MRIRDYLALGWDQLRRRKVVTLLCVMGIAIGSASIVVALAFGESISHYSTQQMSRYLKTDEITVINTSGGGQGRQESIDDFSITPQKMNLIRSLPHVKSAASFGQMGHMRFLVDETRSGYVNVTATELDTLADFGHEFQQGMPDPQDNVIVLNFAATLGLRDSQTSQTEAARRQQAELEQNIIQNRAQAPIVPYPLYRKQIRLQQDVTMPDGSVRTLEFPVRVVAIMKRDESMSDRSLYFSQKIAYISPGLAQQIRDATNAASGRTSGSGESAFEQVLVKVDQSSNVEATDKLIQSLKLRTNNNLSLQESLGKEFVIVRIIFGGVGLFILFVASISIIVAMTMSTHQRRRQIGIMKVLGAGLGQIRNMFVVESALLGIIGGLTGILFAYWVIWGINIILLQTGNVSGPDGEILFISFWILPLGLFFAMMTGIMSGIFPAIKASRTDALTAIKRE